MPSPDKLFRLDPVETKIVAPTTNFQVLAEAADQSVANRSLGRGLTAFSQALGGLAQFKKQQQIRNDIKTAKDAAVRGEVMPDVLPVAETAYQNVIDKNTASESLLAIERFENGEDFDTLIKSETPSDQKTSQIEASYDDFYARAAQSMQNPDLIQNLRITVNGLKEKAYQKVYERERDLRTIEGIHGLKNTLGETKRFAEATGIPLIETLTPNWVLANAKDLGKSHPYLSLPERKLLAFQTLTTDIDVLADPQIIEEIMKSEYNKGFTFRNLYEGKGDDAEEFQKIYNAYVQNSKDYFTKLDQDATASNKANVAQFKDTIRQEFIETGKTSANGISKRALDSGLFDEAQANKLQKDIQKYMDTNIKFQEGSPEDIAMVDFILAHGVTTEIQVDALVLAGSLNPALATKYKNYLKEENKQKLAFIGKYKEYVKDIAKNALSLSKLALGNKMRDILGGVDRDVTPAEMMRAMLGTGLPTDQVNNIIGQIQDFHNGLNAEAEKLGLQDSVADRADGAIPPEHLQKFQLRVENQINKLIVAIDKGLESRPDTRKANLPSLEFPVIPTSDEFPLVVNQTKNIFDKSGFALQTGPDISPTVDSGIATFDIETSFLQAQNMTLRSYVLDATTKNWPKPLSDVVIAEILPERKDKEAGPYGPFLTDDPKVAEAKRRKQETLDNMNKWFSDLGENIGLIPGFLKEVFTPGLDMKTGKMRVPYADLSPEEQKEVIQRKREELDNIDKTVIDAGKNLLNLMKSIVGVGEAEGSSITKLGDPTGRETTEGRKEYTNNLGGTSTELTIGVTNPKINDGKLTHIPSIYNGKIVSQKEAEQIIIDNKGHDPETGKFITPGGDPKARSEAIELKEVVVSAPAPIKAGTKDRIKTAGGMAGEEPIIKNEAKGQEVTKAAIERAVEILGDDKGILKFIAQKESKNGEDKNTFKNKDNKPYHGGIFQVDKIGFESTKDLKSHPKLKQHYRKIKQATGIDWTKVEWGDLRKPLYGAIAARLFLLNIPKNKGDMSNHAEYWKDNYNTQAGKG